MKKKTLFYLAGAAALGTLSAVQGLGPFNRIRFKEQHEAVAKYVETHYPNALYSSVVQTKNGWMTMIRQFNLSPVILYISKSPDGSFIFRETIA